MNTVLILGARGRFGQSATHAFARAGWRVLAQARPGHPAPASTPAPVTWLPLALNHTGALLDAAQGAQVVVHALNPSSYTHHAWQTEAPALMDAAMAVSTGLGATLMMPGNVYNHGRHLPALLSEDTPHAADHPKGLVRVALEQRLQRLAETTGGRSIVIRAGDFFGQGSGSWLDRVMAQDLARGWLTLPGPRDVAHAWAYLPDLAETFVQVAERRAQLPACATLHFQGHTLTLDDWVQALEADWGPLRVKTLPWPLLRVLSLGSPTLRSLCEMRYLWTRPHALDNTRLRALLGAEPHTPFPRALRQALGALGHTPPPRPQPQTLTA